MTDRDALDYLLAGASAKWDAMSPAEREAMLRVQRESWARGEMAMGKDRSATRRPRMAETAMAFVERLEKHTAPTKRDPTSLMPMPKAESDRLFALAKLGALVSDAAPGTLLSAIDDLLEGSKDGMGTLSKHHAIATLIAAFDEAKEAFAEP